MSQPHRFFPLEYALRTLPGAPDGEYVVIQYATRFEHKPSIIETVTPMLDKDGSWKARGAGAVARAAGVRHVD